MTTQEQVDHILEQAPLRYNGYNFRVDKELKHESRSEPFAAIIFESHLDGRTRFVPLDKLVI